jgi:acyl-coenzyme A synthetase/AMP-(fatty) acid ligase/3-hydroxymyristoyl/3-hydroxydecanoyl-(acyl carrier protein) dehydratase
MINSFLNQSAVTVGWRAGVPVGRDAFLARVTSWYATLLPLDGEKFALYVEDSIEFAAILFGAWHAGKTIWLSADALSDNVAALKGKVDGFIGEFPDGCKPVLNAFTVATPEQLDPLDGDFVGLVVYTSGSTGEAQAIPKKLSQLTTEVATLEQLFGARLGDAEIVSTVSHQHIYGLLFNVLWPLYAGRAIHSHTLKYPEQLAQQLALRCSVLISSPAHLKRLPNHLTWTPCKAVFCSGGVLPADVALASADVLGSVPVEVYGSSETGGIAWRQRTNQADDAWQPMPGVAWRCDPFDQLIEIQSPHLFTRDWFKMADRIQNTPDGQFILIGRCDRIVKIEEKRISLNAIEHKLLTSPLVREVKLVTGHAAQSNSKRQQLAAVVVLTGLGQQCLRERGKLATNRELKGVLTDTVEPVAVPRRWRYVVDFPVNAQGKTTLAMLQALFDNEPATIAAPLYSLMNRDLQHAEIEVRWPSHLHYFEGHFPNAPVLPGVAQVQWAIKIAREIFTMPTAFHAMHGLKFQHVVFPNDVTLLKLHYDEHKHSLSFAYTSATRQHSSGRVLFND